MLKLIACNVFLREACYCIARSPQVVDPEFTELGEHVHSPSLRALLQGRIDAAEATGKPYEAIALLFGLCGNATVGLTARSKPLVIPRAHDCCTILLGSKASYLQHFRDNPSTPFSSSGYLDRGDYFLRTGEDTAPTVEVGDQYQKLVEQYGEEDAKFIWEQMHPKLPGHNRAVFIDNPETTPVGYFERFVSKAEGMEIERLAGSLRLVRNLIEGKWEPVDFLVVPPGKRIEGVYDHEEVMKAG